MSQHIAILLLGSNIGSKEKNINTALEKLESAGCKILSHTKFLETKPVEFDSCNNFCNIATSISTQFSPIKLLHLIKKIERELGRTEDTTVIGKYSDRLIDIDIVSYNNLTYSAKKLQIPHLKHLNDRLFSKQLLNDLRLLNTKHNI